MSSNVAAVVVLCGPHDEGEKAPTRRIDRGIRDAIEYDAPLLIAGDSNKGKDVEYFFMLALEKGVKEVIPLFDARVRPSTIEDIRHAISYMNAHPERFLDRTKIVLVTDVWHMERAKVLLVGEARKLSILCQKLEIVSALVMNGPLPPEWVLIGEKKGIQDYFDGKYGASHVAHRPYGKPSMEAEKTDEPDESDQSS